jgi:hypothetical protein
MTMQIITNWVPRNMLAWHELAPKHREFFDYIGEHDVCTPRFVQYRGEWHDVFDTQTIDPVTPGEYTGYMGWGVKVHPGSPLCLFDSVESDSFFSGVLYRLVGEDQVVVGRYFT